MIIMTPSSGPRPLSDLTPQRMRGTRDTQADPDTRPQPWPPSRRTSPQRTKETPCHLTDSQDPDHSERQKISSQRHGTKTMLPPGKNVGFTAKINPLYTDVEPFTDWLSLHLSLILSRSSHQPFHRRWSLRLPSAQPKTVSPVSPVQDPRGPGHHHSRHGGLGVNTDIMGEGGHQEVTQPRHQTWTQVSGKWKQAFLCELIIQRAMRTIQSVNNALNSQWLA